MVAMHQHKSWLWGPLSRLGIGTAIASAVIDQAHKWWMLYVYQIQEKGRVPVLSWLDLKFELNTGVSYGLFPMNSPAGQWFWAGFAALAVFAMALWLARGVTTGLVALSLGLIMGGAASNAIDRLALGGVADFFSMHAYGYYWYVFNIADVAIVAGVVGLIYDSLIVSRKEASKDL